MSARRVMAATLFMTFVLTFAPHTRGGPDEERARRAKIVVKVGEHSVTVGELEDRLAEIPPAQLETFGVTKDEVAKTYVNQVLIRELVLRNAAEARKLDEKLPTKQQVQRARSTATLRALKTPYVSAAAVPIDAVTKYYEAHRARFDSPERMNLWRILCKTREEADTVLATAKKELTIPKWNDLAREHSIDKATHLRGGNLGFLAPDGTSNEAGVKVEVALVKAAQSVKDGELLPNVVPEGASFAVVWRRSTVPAVKRTLEDAAAQIRTTIFRETTEAAEKKLIDDLRAQHVKDYDPEPLKIIELPPFDAGLGLPRSIPSK